MNNATTDESLLAGSEVLFDCMIPSGRELMSYDYRNFGA